MEGKRKENGERSRQGSQSWESSMARAGIYEALAEQPMGVPQGALANATSAAGMVIDPPLLSHHWLLGAHGEDGERNLEVPGAGKVLLCAAGPTAFVV